MTNTRVSTVYGVALLALVVVFLVGSGLNVAVVPWTSTGGGRNEERAACDEIYVVGEGETLHTIGDKCNDPFIVERNPHIQDPDDVFPGLVIRIVPLQTHAS